MCASACAEVGLDDIAGRISKIDVVTFSTLDILYVYLHCLCMFMTGFGKQLAQLITLLQYHTPMSLSFSWQYTLRTKLRGKLRCHISLLLEAGNPQMGNGGET